GLNPRPQDDHDLLPVPQPAGDGRGGHEAVEGQQGCENSHKGRRKPRNGKRGHVGRADGHGPGEGEQQALITLTLPAHHGYGTFPADDCSTALGKEAHGLWRRPFFRGENKGAPRTPRPTAPPRPPTTGSRRRPDTITAREIAREAGRSPMVEGKWAAGKVAVVTG